MSKRYVVRILFYCDDADENVLPIDGSVRPRPGNTPDNSAYRGGEHEFALGITKGLLENQSELHGDRLITYEVDVVNRNYEYDGTGKIVRLLDESNLNLITPELLQPYGQIWIFGMHYGNNLIPVRSYSPTEQRLGGAPDWAQRAKQELTNDELQVLEKWMDAGNGVLITGDHSNPVNNDSLNLGRSLGRSLKRASEMRIWDGGPPLGGPDVVDTSHGTSGAGESDMSTMLLQQDGTPQNISFTPPNVFRRAGEQIIPHPLFQTRSHPENPTGVIKVLPDHAHEGALNIPGTYSHLDHQGAPVWPSKNGNQPKPEIVAWGTNFALPKPTGIWDRRSRQVGVVSAYDGHAVGVGNIVAHSTWHHFINVNLVGFLDGKKTTPTLRRIGEYYANLASYLDNPFALRIRYLDNIIRYVKWRRPFSDGPDFGGTINTKNPVLTRADFANEVGKHALQQLRGTTDFVWVRKFLLDQVASTLNEHGIDQDTLGEMNDETLLGHILLNSPDIDEASEGAEQGRRDAIEIAMGELLQTRADHLVRSLKTLEAAVARIRRRD